MNNVFKKIKEYCIHLVNTNDNEKLVAYIPPKLSKDAVSKSHCLVSESVLTPEQRKVITKPPTSNCIIFGPPRGGKSVSLLYRAHYLSQVYQTSEELFGIFVFSNISKVRLTEELGLLKMFRTTVHTIDDWCCQFYVKNISVALPNIETDKLDYVAIRESVRDFIKSKGSGASLFRYVLIDGGEELQLIHFEIINLIARHITVCIDCCRWHGVESDKGILSILGKDTARLPLTKTFVSNAHIANLAAKLISNPEDAKYFADQANPNQATSDIPRVYIASGPKDAKNILIRVIEERRELNESIGIFVFSHEEIKNHVSLLKEHGFKIEAQKKCNGEVFNDSIFYGKTKIKILTFASCKGFMFDTVIMPHLVSNTFEIKNPTLVDWHLLVGLLRAKKWACMISQKSSFLPNLYKLLGLRNNCVMVESNKKTQEMEDDLDNCRNYTVD